MSTATDNQPELLHLQSGEIRVYAPPAWLTRKFVILALIGIFSLGPVPIAFIATATDQWLRNTIDGWMSDPDLYESLSLEPDEYLALPLHWRQALAEVSVRPPTAELADVRELVTTLTPEQITLIDKIAPYVIDGVLVRDAGKPSKHPMPGLSLVDFATLEDLQILQEILQGYRMPNLPLNRPFTLVGTTAALRVQRTDPQSEFSLPVTRLTEPGRDLVRLLRVPSNARYFEWIAREIGDQGVNVTVWTGIRPDRAVRIQRDAVAPWPDEDDS